MDFEKDESGYVNQSAAPVVDGAQLSILFLSGEIAWGPSKVDLAQQRVGDLCKAVAKKQGVPPQAVILVAGEKQLSPSCTLLEEGVSGPNANLKATCLPVLEMAKRMLADKFKRDDPSEMALLPYWYQVNLVSAVSPLTDDESQAFVAALAGVCGCGESGFSKEVAGWLIAICTCPRVSGPNAQFNREYLDQELAFKTCCPGLLALDIARFGGEDDIMVYLVDLQGELAKLFGEDPKRGEGAVWLYKIESEFLCDIRKKFNTEGMEYSLMHLQKLVEHRKQNPGAQNQGNWLPNVVASSLTDFFVRWDAEGKMPCDATDDLPGVTQFFKDIEKAAQQKFKEKLQAIADVLSKGEKATYLSEADLRPFAELMGWIPTPASHPENLWPLVDCKPIAAWPSLEPDAITASWHDQFEKICNRDWTEYDLPELKLSMSENGLPTEAFISFVQYDNPLLNPARFDYVEIIADEVRCAEVLGALRQGPLSSKGRYLSKDDQDFVASQALARSLFKMLDKDADGFLSCEELRPFAEMMYANFGNPESPDQQLVLTPFHPDMFADGSPGMPGTQMPSESQLLERWQDQYAKMCKCWEADGAYQLSESGFIKSIMQSKWVTPVAPALMWVLQCLQAGLPPGGHYMQIEQYGNIKRRNGNFDEAAQYHEVPPPDCFGQEAYTLACLGGGVAQKVEWTDPYGDVYSILVHAFHALDFDEGDEYVPGLYRGAPAANYE